MIWQIRYRSYYYDKKIGLYYLNNRYYDSNIMEFISLEDISYLLRIVGNLFIG
jgi:RHS repeat-associated protein